jgi:hypothetical protein
VVAQVVRSPCRIPLGSPRLYATMLPVAGNVTAWRTAGRVARQPIPAHEETVKTWVPQDS